ncbi:hypothetical protein [Nannocystis pusilla]|uniref:hypothetical protein n=1 Tax=Nannocystis pusilla TaxID=889268 RepID=UPI003B81D3F2
MSCARVNVSSRTCQEKTDAGVDDARGDMSSGTCRTPAVVRRDAGVDRGRPARCSGPAARCSSRPWRSESPASATRGARPPGAVRLAGGLRRAGELSFGTGQFGSGLMVSGPLIGSSGSLM